MNTNKRDGRNDRCNQEQIVVQVVVVVVISTRFCVRCCARVRSRFRRFPARPFPRDPVHTIVGDVFI